MPQPKAEPTASLSRESLLRVNGLLLAACATLLTIAVALAAYMAWDRQRLAQLRGGLLAQRQLQEQLLANQASDQAAFPHLDRGVSFVLNPDMQEATWHSDRDQPYTINRIGLRGAEIAPPEVGVRRIALVGDSVLFGWKLHEEEKLASLLQALADQRLGAGKYEFVTIALPGWNTTDQDSFLRSHLASIDPDYIIWSLLRNDLLDSAGVVPPGILMSWNAPQKTRQQPFQFLPPATLRDAPAPGILSRWEANLRRIGAFAQDYQVAVSLLWWRARQRPLLDHVLARTGLELPVVHIPGRYRYDEANWCVEFPDCHPTLWANQRLAIGLMDELVRAGIIEPLTWQEEESAVVDAFRSEHQRRASADQQRAFLQEQAALAPAHYRPDQATEEGQSPVLFGIRGGKMHRNGRLLLRLADGATTLAMDIATLGERPGPAQGMHITVHTDRGLVAEQSFNLAQRSNQLRLAVPAEADYGLYEIRWQFVYAECAGPSRCHSARLLDARLLRGSAGDD